MGRAGLVRLDALLVRRGLAASRQRARELIEQGQVAVDGLVATKVGAQVRPEQAVELRSGDHVWVGRGALKLLGVLEPLGVDPEGRTCADLGASTGGFTEVLLERGARRVYAVDVGKGQLAWKLRTDPRVVVMEGVNARHLEALPEPVDLVVGDLSFISLALVLPAVARILAPEGEAVVLVKPQFEAGREGVASGGLVRDPEVREAAIARVCAEAEAEGFRVLGGVDSPVAGARAGNVEHFLHLRRGVHPDGGALTPAP
ncbi:MAG: TlyA family RNA methyltransferase [Alphaproteobacteria bacterium]|nr:TlyA family RNA methyltransferase [Alphaproteobacteria bacterium]